MIKRNVFSLAIAAITLFSANGSSIFAILKSSLEVNDPQKNFCEVKELEGFNNRYCGKSLIFSLDKEENTACLCGINFNEVDSSTIEKNIIIPAAIQISGKQYVVTAIGGGAFKTWPIESVEIPSTVKIIKSEAFYCCESLKKVIINNGAEEIKEYAFYGTNIEVFEIPASVRELGKSSLHSEKVKKVILEKGSNLNNDDIINALGITIRERKIKNYIIEKSNLALPSL